MIRNDLIGVYRTLNFDGHTYVVENATRDRTLVAEPKAYMQGTPATTIMDIGMAGETFTINAPILVGGGEAGDGKLLIARQLEKLTNLATLPIITNATVDIKEGGATVTCKLESDGNPETSGDIFQLNDPGYQVGLDPSANMPTRIAKNYDIEVGFGPYQYFVQDGNISIDVSIDKKVFFAAVGGGTLGGLIGTPYPLMGVSEVKVSGKGTAATILGEYNDPFEFNSFNDTHGKSDITIQNTGEMIYDNNPFAINVSGVPLFGTESAGSLVDFSKAVIKRSAFNANTKILTVTFDFIAYVKLPNTTF